MLYLLNIEIHAIVYFSAPNFPLSPCIRTPTLNFVKSSKNEKGSLCWKWVKVSAPSRIPPCINGVANPAVHQRQETQDDRQRPALKVLMVIIIHLALEDHASQTELEFAVLERVSWTPNWPGSTSGGQGEWSYISTPSFCGTGDQMQSFIHAKWELYQRSSISCLFVDILARKMK